MCVCENTLNDLLTREIISMIVSTARFSVFIRTCCLFNTFLSRVHQSIHQPSSWKTERMCLVILCACVHVNVEHTTQSLALCKMQISTVNMRGWCGGECGQPWTFVPIWRREMPSHFHNKCTKYVLDTMWMEPVATRDSITFIRFNYIVIRSCAILNKRGARLTADIQQAKVQTRHSSRIYDFHFINFAPHERHRSDIPGSYHFYRIVSERHSNKRT